MCICCYNYLEVHHRSLLVRQSVTSSTDGLPYRKRGKPGTGVIDENVSRAYNALPVDTNIVPHTAMPSTTKLDERRTGRLPVPLPWTSTAEPPDMPKTDVTVPAAMRCWQTWHREVLKVLELPGDD